MVKWPLARWLTNVGLVVAGMALAYWLFGRTTVDPTAQAQMTISNEPAAVVVAPETGRTGFEPLSTNEQTLALKAVMARLNAERSTVTPNPAAPKDQQLEMLAVERFDEGKTAYLNGSWARRAHVQVYDYARNGLVSAVVALDSGKVERVELLNGVQPPLTQREIRRALMVALADPTGGPELRRLYQGATGAELKDPAALIVYGFSYIVDPLDSAALQASRCGPNRCALLLINTPDQVQLPATPVVDLSTGTLVQVTK